MHTGRGIHNKALYIYTSFIHTISEPRCCRLHAEQLPDSQCSTKVWTANMTSSQPLCKTFLMRKKKSAPLILLLSRNNNWDIGFLSSGWLSSSYSHLHTDMWIDALNSFTLLTPSRSYHIFISLLTSVSLPISDITTVQVSSLPTALLRIRPFRIDFPSVSGPLWGSAQKNNPYVEGQNK